MGAICKNESVCFCPTEKTVEGETEKVAALELKRLWGT